MDKLNVELSKEDLLAIIGALVKYHVSTGLYDDDLDDLIQRLQVVATENVDADDIMQIINKYINQ